MQITRIIFRDTNKRVLYDVPPERVVRNGTAITVYAADGHPLPLPRDYSIEYEWDEP